MRESVSELSKFGDSFLLLCAGESGGEGLKKKELMGMGSVAFF